VKYSSDKTDFLVMAIIRNALVV